MVRVKLIVSTIVLLAVLFLCTIISNGLSAQDAGKTIKTGDYIVFGMYNGEKIKWRVINSDKNGYLLFSDRVISMKAYDSSGDMPGGRGGDGRKSYGSNDWVTSNLRCWLNSDKKNVNYSSYSKPDSKGVYGGVLPYADKAGFLYQFKKQEKDQIVPASLQTIISQSDKSVKDSGTENHLYNETLSNMLSNYNKAMKRKSTDKVFLLDIRQMYDYVYKRGYKTGKLITKAAITESGIESDFLTPSTYYSYFLRDAYSLNSCWVRYMSTLQAAGERLGKLG